MRRAHPLVAGSLAVCRGPWASRPGRASTRTGGDVVRATMLRIHPSIDHDERIGQNHMEATLVMFKADGSRKDFPIKANKRYLIGRKDSCDLRIPLAEVSREHAAIYFDEDEEELVIEDLGSSNGTWVNNEKVDRADLCPGDVIVVGDVPLQIVIDGHPAEVHPISPQEIQATREEGAAKSNGDVPTVMSRPAPKAGAAPPAAAGAGPKKDAISLNDDDEDDDFDLEALAAAEEDDSFFNFDVDDDSSASGKKKANS